MKETRNQLFLRTLQHILFQLHGIDLEDLTTAETNIKELAEGVLVTAGSRKVVTA